MAIRCPGCGTEISGDPRFCPACGRQLSTLARASPTREVRKTVTVLFGDVVGSTALGERLDPESVRSLLARYFATMRVVLERHGGTVEKFIGDAVMAVFGVPTLHEDDALRAVRAAAEIRTALDDLNLQLEAERGFRIDFRIGIDTGEVVAGEASTDGTLVTGDAVNTAARLEQSADPGDILLGAATYRLVHTFVLADRVDAVAAKGKSEPLVSYRLVSVKSVAGREPRWVAATLVGRGQEIDRLRAALSEVEVSHEPQLVTVLGVAGIGKSRLVAEFIERIADRATVLRGHCLPYGDGATYFPLAELVQAAAGIVETDDRGAANKKVALILPPGSESGLVAQALASATGLGPAVAHQEEIFWAVRRLLEHLAGDRPIVVIFEDIHWAEPTFLDLLEYLGDVMTGDVLLLALARPELFERRPGWASALSAASLVRLDALTPDAAAELLEGLDGGDALPTALRGRILEAAEGNPLYVEEMLGMLVDEGHLTRDETGWRASASLEDVHVPPTIGALLAARIDGLPDAERDVAERASVVGRVFEAAAIRELVVDGATDDVGRNLLGLVRKELIRQERAELSVGDAYGFRHVLIRDAAYHALPKLDRADLHERFAGWLERVAGDRIAGYEEILGYHLEQACAYREELGLRDERTRQLGIRARRWLASAGNRAFERHDVRSSTALLARAIRLTAEDDPGFAALALRYVDGLLTAGEFAPIAEWLDRIEALPSLTTVDAAEAHFYRFALRDEVEGVSVSEVRRELACVLPPLVRGRRFDVAVTTWRFLGGAHQNAGSIAKAEAAYRRAAHMAALWHVRDSEIDMLLVQAQLGARSRMAVHEVIDLATRVLESPGVTKAQRAEALEHLAYVGAQEGRFEEARDHLRQAESDLRELGHAGRANQIAITRGLVERFAREPAASAAAFRSAYDDNVMRVADGLQGFVAARLGQALLDAGPVEEARAFIEEAERAEGRNVWTASIVGGARARLLVHDGRPAEGLAFVQEVLSWGRGAGLEDLAILFGNALDDVAVCAEAAGDLVSARQALEEALEVYDAKGDLVDAAHARSELARLQA